MAGFEVIVRPVVFPNIRPQPSRSLPPASDDPTHGQAVFSGGSGKVIALSHSFSASGTRPGGEEIDRTYDTVRIGAEGGQTGEPQLAGGDPRLAAAFAVLAAAGDDDAYIDVEVLKSVRMKGFDGAMARYDYAPVQEAENITIIQRDMTRSST